MSVLLNNDTTKKPELKKKNDIPKIYFKSNERKFREFTKY